MSPVRQSREEAQSIAVVGPRSATVMISKEVLGGGCGGDLGSRGLKPGGTESVCDTSTLGVETARPWVLWVSGPCKITDLKILQERDRVPKAKVRSN